MTGIRPRRRADGAVQAVRHALGEGAERLAQGPSRFGPAGRALRAGVLRAARPLMVRQAHVDAELITALETLSFETGVAHGGVSSFPEALDPGAVVEVKTEAGALYAHAGDRIITPYLVDHGVWEPEETAWMRRVLRPGATALDVGANLGYFSVLAAGLVGPSGQVIAVEPEPRNLALLRANLWRHRAANAVVLPIAAAAATGFVPLRLNEDNRGDHQVGLPGEAQSLVPSARLDELLDGLVIDVVKVDAQGFDSEVIAGLAGVVEHSPRIAILTEFWLTGMEARDIDALAVARSYAEGFDLDLLAAGGETTPITPDGLCAAAEDAPDRYVNVVLTR